MSITKTEEDLLQVVRMSQFPSFEKIKIRLVAKNSYDNWPRSRQVPKRAVLKPNPCARTGFVGWQDRSGSMYRLMGNDRW